MPCTNASNFAETLVRLSWQLLRTPTVSNTFETMTFGYSDGVDDLILLEDILERNWLLEQALGVGNLLGDSATVDLDLHEVSLLLLDAGEMVLGVGENADDGAVLPDALKFTREGFFVLRVLLCVFGESLLFGAVPVPVEATLEVI